MEMRQLTGSVKVAILTNAIGLKAARPILERLTDEQRQLIYKLQSKLGAVPQELKDKVAKEFLETTGGYFDPDKPGDINSSESGGDDKKAQKSSASLSSLEAIQNLETNHLFQLIKDEHPQTIAQEDILHFVMTLISRMKW